MNPSKTTLRQRLRRLRGSAVYCFGHRFAATTSGMAAAEFAMISPILIVMFFGVTEFSNAYEANTKVTAVVSTLADLLSQEKVVCDTEKTAAFGASYSIMYPFPHSAMKLRISSLIDNGNGTVKVAWSDSSDNANYPPHAVNSAQTIPAGLVPTGESVLWAEVQYTYTLPVHLFFGPSVSFDDEYYMHPRKVKQIGRETTPCT